MFICHTRTTTNEWWFHLTKNLDTNLYNLDHKEFYNICYLSDSRKACKSTVRSLSLITKQIYCFPPAIDTIVSAYLVFSFFSYHTIVYICIYVRLCIFSCIATMLPHWWRMLKKTPMSWCYILFLPFYIVYTIIWPLWIYQLLIPPHTICCYN